jgi:hypothetical protein
VIARHAAAEAVIDAAAVVGVKAWTFFAMERAAGPHVALAGLAFALVPQHMLPHHLRYRQALTDLIEKLIGKAHEVLSKHSLPQSHQETTYPQQVFPCPRPINSRFACLPC